MFLRRNVLDDLFWRPWSDFHRFTRNFEGSWPLGWGVDEVMPRVNVWSAEQQDVVRARAPGVDLDSLDLSIEGQVLTIKGERKEPELGENDAYRRRERGFGQFVRSVELPYDVQTDEVRARYEHGVLEVLLPRAAAHRPKKITVASA